MTGGISVPERILSVLVFILVSVCVKVRSVIMTVVTVIHSLIFCSVLMPLLVQASCNCGDLTSCMIRAWLPCWAGKDQQAMVIGLQLFPTDIDNAACPYEWKRLRGIDPNYSHWQSIMNCQTNLNVCHASISVDGGPKVHKVRDAWGLRCSVQAERCQHIFGSSCQKFDDYLHWAQCWQGNNKIDPTVWTALEAAWTCEAKQRQTAPDLSGLLISSSEQDDGLPV